VKKHTTSSLNETILGSYTATASAWPVLFDPHKGFFIVPPEYPETASYNTYYSFKNVFYLHQKQTLG
jgi:hypothetical protein